MRETLVGRVTRAYVLLAVAIVAFTCIASMGFALHQIALGISQPFLRQVALIRTEAGRLEAHGVPFEQAARALTSRPRRLLSVQVYDPSGRLVAGPRSGGGYVSGRLQGALGLRAAEFPLDGGFVRITPDRARLASEIRAYLLFNVPIAIIAILFAWWAGQKITLRATRPLAAITTALNTVGDGDFGAKSIMALDQTREVELLAKALQRATMRVAAAMGERDRAQSELRRFVADAGHELRTPLTVIVGYVDALRSGVAEVPPGTRDVVDAINVESRRMRRIVEDLIVLARLGHEAPQQKEVLSLRDTLASIVRGFKPQARSRIRDAGGDAMVVADPDAIARAVRNVIDNALLYTPGAVDVAIVRDGEFAAMTIVDEGPGMAPEDIATAFEPFHRGQRTRDIEGTGLGLAIVKNAIESNSGQVTLRSSLGTGTNVELRLPLARASQIHSVHAGERPEAGTAISGLWILSGTFERL